MQLTFIHNHLIRVPIMNPTEPSPAAAADSNDSQIAAALYRIAVRARAYCDANQDSDIRAAAQFWAVLFHVLGTPVSPNP
jgi:hypothetical protein